jgi:hypothetical protein
MELEMYTVEVTVRLLFDATTQEEQDRALGWAEDWVDYVAETAYDYTPGDDEDAPAPELVTAFTTTMGGYE